MEQKKGKASVFEKLENLRKEVYANKGSRQGYLTESQIVELCKLKRELRDI